MMPRWPVFRRTMREGQPHRLGQARDAAAQHPAKNGRDPGRKFSGEFFPDKTPPALHPKIPFRQTGVIGHESVVRHAVAIQQNKVLTRGGGQALVEDDRLAKAEMLVPDMAQGRGDFLPPLPDEFAGGGAGTVIGQQYFAGHDGLALHAVQDLIQGAGLLIGRDDQGDLGGAHTGWLDCRCSKRRLWRTRVE